MKNMIEVFAESIKDLYAMTHTRAEREFKRIGGTLEEFAMLENALGKENMRQEEAMLRSLVSIGKRMHYTGAEWFESFAREYQAMTNHQVLPGDDAFVGSPYLFEVMQMIPEMKRNPAQVFGMIEYTLDAHNAIDMNGGNLKLSAQMISIAHHAFDWMMMTRPADMILDIAPVNAIIMCALVARIQNEVMGMTTSFPEDMFTKHIYPDEIKTFTERVAELMPVLLCEVNDPHMLLADAESAPDDWFSRMKKIAPAMQDHFGEEAPNGSIKSGFYP